MAHLGLKLQITNKNYNHYVKKTNIVNLIRKYLMFRKDKSLYTDVYIFLF